ncbi:MAG: PAS domain-containing protein [Planctomycetes bacterium]|nr:PAS domain-containing protein [Planctomycetota bacterium]
MRTMVEEEKNVEALQQAMELFNATADRLRETHDTLRTRVQELTTEVKDLSNRLENVLASITDGVVAVDAALRITTVNAAAGQLGFSEGSGIEAALGESSGRLMPCIEGAMKGAATTAKEEEVSFGGERKVLSFSVAPLHGGEGAGPTGAVISFRDVTEIMRLKADLERKERLAVLGEMAAAIAHEVRNPLGGLRLFAGLAGNAAERADSGDVLKHLNAISSGIGEIDATIENVLTFARDMEARFASVTLAIIVAEAIEELNGLFEETGAEVKVEIPADVVVRADRRLMRRAVANLIDNAVKVQGEGGTVEIRHEVMEGPPPMLGIIVADRGPGVDEAGAVEWFAPFRTGRAEGTGLGLAIVERVAEAHGGRAELRPRPGGGAEALIILPATAGEEG